jgi:trimeric autotransporter adhesin
LGYVALSSNTTGCLNVAVGSGALQCNTTATGNTAVGVNSLILNTTGCQNVAVGSFALDANTEGNTNVALGYNSLTANTTASNNTAVGYRSLCANTTGTLNAAVGEQALAFATGTGCNTAVGSRAGLSVTTGNDNVFLGLNSGRAASPFEVTTQSNRMVLGNNNITNAYVKVAWTVTSDCRDKMNIASVPHGLCFVNQLNPVLFQFKKSREEEIPHGNKRYGFLAQDILSLEGENPVIIDNEQPDTLKYNGEALVPVLVNAIKELTAEINLLKNK